PRARLCLGSAERGKPAGVRPGRGADRSPAWSPDGWQIMFMSSMLGDPDLFTTDADGGRRKRITHSPGVDTSPAWNPKTGQQTAFVSDRGGLPRLYLMDADGSNVEALALPDMTYVIDPSWSPNGQLLALSARRRNGNYE